MSIYDVLFDKSDSYHHMINNLNLCKGRVNILVNDKLLPDDLMNVNMDICVSYKKDCLQYHTFHMFLQVNGGGYHSNMHLQNLILK